MTQATDFTVSARDRDYMHRLGRYVAEANDAARSEWLALTGAERLARSERLARPYRTRARVEKALSADNPAPLYEHARRLGLLLEH